MNIKKAQKKIGKALIRHQWKNFPKKLRPYQFSSSFLHKWNVAEERANSISHAFGIVMGITALVLMIVDAVTHNSTLGIISGIIFGITLIITYLSSTIYHWVFYPPFKQFFKIMDHCSIFLLIAGTYTPFCLITLHGTTGWSLFGVVWGLATIGILLKIFFVDKFQMLSTFVYLGMGWLIVTVISQLIHNLPLGGIVLLAIGGLCYTVGVIFFVFEKIPFFHTIWHGFVLAGSMAHFFSVLFYVIPVKI